MTFPEAGEGSPPSSTRTISTQTRCRYLLRNRIVSGCQHPPGYQYWLGPLHFAPCSLKPLDQQGENADEIEECAPLYGVRSTPTLWLCAVPRIFHMILTRVATGLVTGIISSMGTWQRALPVGRVCWL